jgi:hypothetical protein
MYTLDKGILAELPAESTDLTRAWVGAGEPVYRITDNNLWYLAFWKERTAHKLNETSSSALAGGASAQAPQLEVEAEEETADDSDSTGKDSDSETNSSAATAGEAPLAAEEVIETGASIDDYAVGRKVTLDLGATRVTALVHSVEERADGWFVVLSSDMYYKDLVKYRKKAVRVIFEEYSGAVVGRSAIRERDGQQGVYVRQQSGTWKWVPVHVLRTSGGRCLLSEGTFPGEDGAPVTTVNYYDEVMSDPQAEGY